MHPLPPASVIAHAALGIDHIHDRGSRENVVQTLLATIAERIQVIGKAEYIQNLHKAPTNHLHDGWPPAERVAGIIGLDVDDAEIQKIFPWRGRVATKIANPAAAGCKRKKNRVFNQVTK